MADEQTAEVEETEGESASVDLSALSEEEIAAAEEEAVKAAVKAEEPAKVEPKAEEPEKPARPRDPAGKFAKTPTRAGKFWEAAEKALAGEELADLPDYVDSLNASHFADLPTVAKQIVKDAMSAVRTSREEWAAEKKAIEDAVKAKEADLTKREADFARRQAEFAALAEDPKIKEILAKPAADLPDPMTPEGMQARIDRATAERVNAIFEPIAQSAETKRREAAWLQFKVEHPEIEREPGFLDDMRKELADRKAAGAPITTPQAYELVKGRRAAATLERLRARELAKRQEAAAHMGRQGVQSAPGNEAVPAEIRKRGPLAVLEYLESNPAVQRRVRAEMTA